MSILTFTITEDGLAVRKSADPFHMGTNGDTFQIVVENSDPAEPHQVRMEKIIRKKTGHLMTPFTGQSAWLVFAGGSQMSEHVVKDAGQAPAGHYDYTIVLDSRETDDPEIVVDEGVKTAAYKMTKRSASRPTAKKAAASRKKAVAKKKTAKKKSAPKRAMGKGARANRKTAKRKTATRRNARRRR